MNLATICIGKDEIEYCWSSWSSAEKHVPEVVRQMIIKALEAAGRVHSRYLTTSSQFNILARYAIKYFGFLKRSLNIQVWQLFWIVWRLFLMLPCQTSVFEFPKDMTYVDWTKCSATQHLHCHRPKWGKWVLEVGSEAINSIPKKKMKLYRITLQANAHTWR